MRINLERPQRLPISIASVALLVVDLAILAYLGFVFWKVVPTFGKMFMETGVELPYPTMLVLGLSDLVQSYWFFLLPLVLALAGLMMAKEVYLKSPAARDWLNVACCVFLVAACVVVMMSLFFPLTGGLIQLIEHL